MELRNPINNQHMVDGLNDVIRLSLEGASQCQHLEGGAEGPELKKILQEAAEKHRLHVQKLKDSVLFLGGAPEREDAFSGSDDPMTDIQPSEKFLRPLYHHHQKLIDSCQHHIRELTGSAEAVAVLNEVLDDNRELLARLEEFADQAGSVLPKAGDRAS